MREASLPSSSPGTAAARGALTGAVARGGGGEERAIAATIAIDIPIVSAVAVSESRIHAEEQENLLHDAEQRVAAAEAARQSAEAERRAAVAERRAAEAAQQAAEAERREERRAAEAARHDQEVRLAQLERELAARPPPPTPPQQPPPQQPTRNLFIRYDDEDGCVDDDDDVVNKKQQHQQQVVDTVNATTKMEDNMANEGNNKNSNSGGNSSPQQPLQRQRYCIVGVVVAVRLLQRWRESVGRDDVRHQRQCRSQYRRPCPLRQLPALAPIPFSPISTELHSQVEH
jgi:hypothetical protein